MGHYKKGEKPIIKKQFLKLLKSDKYSGNVKAVCNEIGKSRTTLYRWKEEDSKFSDDWDKIVEIKKDDRADEAELGLRRAVLEGNITAIIFTLKSYRPETYRERYELTGKSGGAIKHRHEISTDLKGWLIKLAKNELKNETKNNK